MRFCAPGGSCSVGSCRAAVWPCCCCCRCVTLQLSAERTGCSRGGHRPSNDLSLVWASHLTQSTDAMLCNSNRVGRSDRPPEPGRRVIRPCQVFLRVCSALKPVKTTRPGATVGRRIARFSFNVCLQPFKGPFTERMDIFETALEKKTRLHKVVFKKIPVYTETLETTETL